MTKRPIGYWLREADRLITERGFAPLAERGLTRTHWQVLNLICDETPTKESIADSMKPFGTAEDMVAIVNDLCTRGWAERQDAHLAATESGQKARSELGPLVNEIRVQTMDGISDDDYQSTMRTLQRIVHNLNEPKTGTGS